MIISRTPYRVSLFGGGTDYPPWYREHGGSVLGMSINKYCYLSVRYLPPFFEHRHRIVYSKIENVQDIDQIQHPAVRAVFQEMGVDQGLEVHHDGDLPARSGLGSSSSFTVGLLNALYALRGQRATKLDLAREAIRIEQDVICENVGDQDQIWAAHGGFNRIHFHHSGRFDVEPVIMGKQRQQVLMDHLMLFFTGFSRYATEVVKDQLANMSQRTSQLHAIRRMVDDAQEILSDVNADIAGIGHLLHESWQQKRQLAQTVSTGAIDEIYAEGMAAGAIGGKLLGAGGGGFILFFVPPERQPAVRQRLSRLIEVKIDIDTTGSRIVVYEPDGFSANR